MSFADLEAGQALPSARRKGPIEGKQSPSQSVVSGVFQISTAVSTFQRLANSLGTPKDTPNLRDRLHKTRLHITQLVKDTSTKLKQASQEDHYTEVSVSENDSLSYHALKAYSKHKLQGQEVSKKIGDAKLAKDFEAILKEFQKAQKVAAEREIIYTPFVRQELLPSSYTASEIDISSSKIPEQHAFLVESRRQEVVLLENEIVFNEAIIEEREQGIQEIQQQIGEVNEIFKDLAGLVHGQGMMIDDIQSNIESSHAATAQARSQVAKASKSQKSNSSLVCLLLVIFGIVLLIIIIMIAA